jgi:hypothetical protein
MIQVTSYEESDPASRYRPFCAKGLPARFAHLSLDQSSA